MATLLSSSCSATSPASPSGPATVDGVRVLVRSTTNVRSEVDNSISLGAFSVNTDRVYEDVTRTATWTSSNPAVARSSSSGIFSLTAPGRTELTATYQGFTDSITLDVVPPVPFAQRYPSLTISVFASARLGDRSQASVRLFTTAAESQNLTAVAAWTSSNPAVATVERGGEVRTHGIGTTAITASHDGHSTATYFSVRPGF